MHTLFNFTQVIKDDERGILSRDGRVISLLAPGKHTTLDFDRQLSCEVVKVVRTELPVERALLLKHALSSSAADAITIVQVGSNEVAIVSLDGEPKH